MGGREEGEVGGGLTSFIRLVFMYGAAVGVRVGKKTPVTVVLGTLRVCRWCWAGKLVVRGGTLASLRLLAMGRRA